jgi:hypothetical protein
MVDAAMARRDAHALFLLLTKTKVGTANESGEPMGSSR